MKPIRVRLITDLTRYHPQLIPGIEGITVGRQGLWSRGSDRFISVRFPSVGVFDILWQGLEIIDEEYLEWLAERERERWENLKRATNVTKVVGPRGGFRRLSYQYTDDNGVTHHTSLGFKDEAEEIERFLQQHGIEVKEVRLEQKTRRGVR